MDNPAVLLLSEVYGALRGGFSTIYRRLAAVLREREPDIPLFSAILEATEDDEENAKHDGVELLLPKVDPGDERTAPSLHWLTFDHRVKYPHLPPNVKTIVGHTDGTSRAACGIKKDRCPEATVVLFIDDIPEETEQYKGDEEAMGIGKKEDSILEDAHQAGIVLSFGDRVFNHFKNQFRAIPANKRPQHILFYPRPSKTFENADAEYIDTETMVVLCIGVVTGVEKLKGLDLAVEALSIVAAKIPVKLRVRGVDKDDQVSKAILKLCKSANLQISFLPYGTQKDICKDMLQSHLVLMPSRAEPFGFVGLEAIAVGVPVLVSDKSGLADLINKFAPRYHNCIVKTDVHGYDQMSAAHWAACIEKVLDHCKAEFETAASLKKELLSTRYWEDSERQFIEVFKRKVSSARCEDNGTEDIGGTGSRGSSSDDECPNYRMLRISDEIFDEEVLKNPEKFESKLSYFETHFDIVYPHFNKTLSSKAKLRVKRKVGHQIKRVDRVLFSGKELKPKYDKLVECFAKFRAILKKIEDGCVLCTLEFEDAVALRSFLIGYRDGELSETLTQELITEEMQQEEGPGLFVHVTLLVATDTAMSDDGGSEHEEMDCTPGDDAMQETMVTGTPDRRMHHTIRPSSRKRPGHVAADVDTIKTDKGLEKEDNSAEPPIKIRAPADLFTEAHAEMIKSMETGKLTWATRAGLYMKINEDLSEKDVRSLRAILVTDGHLARGKVEKATLSEIFNMLEEGNKIGKGNLVLLADMLKALGKEKLVQEVEEFALRDETDGDAGILTPKVQLSARAKLYMSIDQEFLDDESRDLRALLLIDGHLSKEVPRSATPHEIFNILEANNKLGERNLTLLLDILYWSGKTDLLSEVEEFANNSDETRDYPTTTSEVHLSDRAKLYMNISHEITYEDTRRLRALLVTDGHLTKEAAEFATPLEILSMLEMGMKIGEGNLELLVDILNTLIMQDIVPEVEKVANSGKTEGNLASIPKRHVSARAKLYLNVENEFTEDDNRKLRAYLTTGGHLGDANIKYATPHEIFNMLEADNKIGEGNLTLLKDMLKALGKAELAQEAEDVEKSEETTST
uniref:DED domain-containing protein n=1 Tax=Branchiostoma floridae TaxID=7739 RepID=C3YC38_BRAFL|eukprot:XP_002606060.1 hypothetical protein BRAFLDRAFT_92079 [Branchiostoma floridae]